MKMSLKMINPWKEINLPPKDLNAIRIDHTHPLDLFWARDHLGRYLFIYEYSDDNGLKKITFHDLEGIQVALVKATTSCPKNRLVLLLRDEGNWEIFFSLCNDLVQVTRFSSTTQNAIHSILQRLARWQNFLKKSRVDVLTEESIKGLIGELIFLQDFLAPVFGFSQAVKFWQGPEGYTQDFNVNDCAIEVKCQSGASYPSVKISSINQLCPQLPSMFLFVVTLGKASPDAVDVINLPTLITHIRESLQSEETSQLDRFNDLLFMFGYFDMDIYKGFNYILSSSEMYCVRKGFPRICPGDIQEGILNLTYSILLSECAPFIGRPGWLEDNK